jgi:cytochrome c556
MSYRARTAAFAATLALVIWAVAAGDSNSADDKGGKVGPYNADILKLADGQGSAKEIADKAELGDVMQAFKPRSKGGLGVGKVPDAVKPDGIEQKFIAMGKSKKGPSKADLTSQADALARAAAVTKAVGSITLLYADKDGKKNPTKWKQYVGEMDKAADDLSKATQNSDSEGVKKAVGKINDSCINCHADFRD